jgi:hypothetical protein
MDGIYLNAAYFGAPDPFDDPPPKTSDDNSFLDNIDGVAWDEQVAKERAPIDGEEALRHANSTLKTPTFGACMDHPAEDTTSFHAGFC